MRKSGVNGRENITYPRKKKSDELASTCPSFTSMVVYEDGGDGGAASQDAVWKVA